MDGWITAGDVKMPPTLLTSPVTINVSANKQGLINFWAKFDKKQLAKYYARLHKMKLILKPGGPGKPGMTVTLPSFNIPFSSGYVSMTWGTK